jgi:hypothetical protein
MFTIHPHSSKSEPEKLSGVIGCRDGGKFGWSRKVGGSSHSWLLSGLSCAVSCLWARFWSQEAKMLLASPVGILLCTAFISSCASASTEINSQLQFTAALDSFEMWTWAGRVKWWERTQLFVLQPASESIMSNCAISGRGASHSAFLQWLTFQQQIHKGQSFQELITCHTSLADIRIKI